MEHEQTAYAGDRVRVDTAEDGPARLSDVAAAQEQLDQACDRLAKQGEMLADRLVNYLRGENPSTLSEGVPKEPPVPAAAAIARCARIVNSVADNLGDLRDRFEG